MPPAAAVGEPFPFAVVIHNHSNALQSIGVTVADSDAEVAHRTAGAYGATAAQIDVADAKELMALVGLPVIMMYFILRAEVWQHFGTTQDVIAAIAIGAGSALAADYIWPRDKDKGDRS